VTPIIGAIIGLFGSLLPEALKLFKDKQDKKHELEVMKLQIQAQAQLHTQRLEEIAVEGDIRDQESVREFMPVVAPTSTGKWWYDLLMALCYVYNTTVRPTITYMIVGMYMFVKFAQVEVLRASGTDFFRAIINVWTEDDTMFMFIMVTFWFGGRQILRSMGKVK